MKVLVIPDIHLKRDIIRKADKLMNTGTYDLAVFLGDFVDDWGRQSDVGLYEKTIDALCGFLESHKNTLVCWGNHDMSYFWNEWETGFSGLARDTVLIGFRKLSRILDEERYGFIHRIDKVLFSHGGLSYYFLKDNGFDVSPFWLEEMDDNIDEIITSVNMMGRKEIWTDDSPIWLRPQEMYDNSTLYPRGYLQVVGHSPVRGILFETKPEGVRLLSCDNFSTDSSGNPLGEQCFVAVDTVTEKWEKVVI